jgi:hypothetical protein
MPAYEICYLEADGTLGCAFSVRFESAMRAKILAHAMKPANCQRLEVWQGRELIYSRPETGDALDVWMPMPHTPRHEPGNIASPA